MNTNVENQRDRLRKKIGAFFGKTMIERRTDYCFVKDMLAESLDKWSLFCIYNLGYYDMLRFSKLKAKIPGISSRMLSLTLKKLEVNGLVSRKVFAEVPPRVEYRLTAFGNQFADQLIEMSQWYITHHPKLTSSETSKNVAL